MPKEIVRADHIRPSLKRNSLGVKAGNMVFVGGNLGVDRDRRLVGSDIRTQTRQALTNIRGILEAAGATMQDVVKVSAFITKREDFDGFNEAYVEFFPSDPPVRTCVIVEMITPGALVEIEATAVVDE